MGVLEGIGDYLVHGHPDYQKRLKTEEKLRELPLKSFKVEKKSIKRKQNMEQFGLYLAIMKDRTGAWSEQAKKAAADSMRRSPVFQEVQERLGGAPMMGQGWGAGMGAGLKGMETTGAKVNPMTGEMELSYEKPGQFGDIPGAYGLVPPEKRAGIAEQALVKPATQVNIMPSSTERTKIAETRASIDALDNLKTLFDSVQTKTGPVTGRVSPIAGLVGMTTDEQEAFMAATSAFKNAIIKEITGAQMSEQEANRIMKQIPDITDPPARWKAKWQQSKKNLEFLQKRRLEILEQSGMRVPGKTEKSTTPITATNPATGEKLQSIDGGKTWQPIK